MHVIRHQHIGMNPTPGLDGILGQLIQIAAVILIGKKTGWRLLPRWIRWTGTLGNAMRARRGMANSDCGREALSLAKLRKPWSVPYYSIRHRFSSILDSILVARQQIGCPSSRVQIMRIDGVSPAAYLRITENKHFGIILNIHFVNRTGRESRCPLLISSIPFI